MKDFLRIALGAGLAAVAVSGFAATPAQVDPAKGKAIASTVCVACHAADGNSVIPTNPKLAGQGAAYLYKQLTNFKSEGGKPPARANPIMNGMAASLSDADMKSLAAYFAAQVRVPAEPKDKSTFALGQQIYRAGDADTGVPACAACHGPTGAGIPVQFPRLSGQFTDYTVAQLDAFRSGARANDPNKMMRMIALRMTDPQIAAVSDYIAGLR